MFGKIANKMTDQINSLTPELKGEREHAEKLQIEAQKSKNILDIWNANAAIHALNSSLTVLELNAIKLAFVDKNGNLTSDVKLAEFA